MGGKQYLCVRQHGVHLQGTGDHPAQVMQVKGAIPVTFSSENPGEFQILTQSERVISWAG